MLKDNIESYLCPLTGSFV